MALIEHLEHEGWEEFFQDMFRYAHDYSDEEIAEIYRMVDRRLMQKGIISKPPPPPNLESTPGA